MTATVAHYSLYRSELVHVVDVCCSAHRSAVGGEEEAARTCSIVLPRRGCYSRHIGRAKDFADARSALFFRRDEGYRIGHPVSGGDDSTALDFPERILDEAFADPTRAYAPFPASRCAIDLGVNRQLHNLRSRIKLGATALEIEEGAIRLLNRIAAKARAEGTSLEVPRRASTLQRQRLLVDRARELLHEKLDQSLSLANISHSVGSSPFHLTRLFRTYTGKSMYRYLTHLRMTAALDRLVGGEADLTRLAGDLGYSSHSHFSDTFRRCFGRPPSHFRIRRLPGGN